MQGPTAKLVNHIPPLRLVSVNPLNACLLAKLVRISIYMYSALAGKLESVEDGAQLLLQALETVRHSCT